MDITNDKEFNMFIIEINETIDIIDRLINRIKSLG